MVDVRNKEILHFKLINTINNEKAIDHFRNDFSSVYTQVNEGYFSLNFTDSQGQVIGHSELTDVLSNLKNQIDKYPGINFIWKDCKSEEPCHERGLYSPVHQFFMDIFLKDNVELSADCSHALGNLKIAKHIIEKEETLLTPEGFYSKNELNHCAHNFKYHTSWDWLMPTWYKVRDIAEQHDILINKQIDDTFGVTIQVYLSNGNYLRFEDQKHTGLKSFWRIILEYIVWFENEIDPNK